MNSSIARLRAAALGVFLCTAHCAHADDLQISGAPPTAVAAGSTYAFHPLAVAAGPLAAHFEILHAPPWAQFSAFDGSLSGNPGMSDVGLYRDVRISLANEQSRVSLPAFSIVVNLPGKPGQTVLTWEPVTQNEDGTPLTDLAGYFVYEGSTLQTLTPLLYASVAGATFSLDGLGAGPHYFYVTSLSSSGVESARSVIVSDAPDALP